MKRLIQLTRDTRLALLLTVLAGFVGGVLIISQALVMSRIINDIFMEQKNLQDVFPGLRALLLIFAGRAFLGWAGEVSSNEVAAKIKHELRVRLYAHLINLGPAYLGKERTGELVSTSMEGIEALDTYYSEYLPQLLVSTIIPVSILVVIFPLDSLSGLILLLTAPLIPLFMYLIGRGAEALTKRQYESLGKLAAFFLDSLQGLTTLKQLGRSKTHIRNIAAASESFRNVTLQVLRITFLSAFALELLATLSVAIIAVEVGLRLLYGHMSFSDALFLLILAPEFYIPLRLLGQRFHAGMSGTTAAQRIFQILDYQLPSNPVPSEVTNPFPDESNKLFSKIEFCHVGYTFPGEDTPILDDISLTIQAGKRIALVGPSGGGKSTLANLLLRFDQPSTGQIFVDGRPISEIPINRWRRMLTWVPQDPYLFHDTVAENIGLANPSASDDLIVQAAQVAHLDAFIDSLPNKYQTDIGEGGAGVSGGQSQRIALARAFLVNSPLLILDEPTSSLDVELEGMLEDSLNKLSTALETRTIIMIAHRLNTIISADQIFLVVDGRIAETGTHKELIAHGGAYARLYTAFAEGSQKNIEPEAGRENRFEKAGGMKNDGRASPVAQTEALDISTHLSTWPIKRLLNFLRGSWGRILVSVVLGSATILASMGLMGTSAYLISAAALHPPIASLEIAIVGVRFFGLSRAVFRYLERLVSHDVTLRILGSLRIWFYEVLEPLAPARLLQYRSGDLLTRIVADVNNLENFYVRTVSPPLVALTITVVTTLYLGSISPQLGFAIAIFLILLGLIVPITTRVLNRKSTKVLMNCRADLASLLVDGIQGMPELLIFDRAITQQERITAKSAEARVAQRTMARFAGLNTAFSVLLTNLGMWSVMVIAIRLVTTGEINSVILASLSLLTLASFEAVAPLPRAAQMLESCLGSASRLFEIVDTRPAINETPVVIPSGEMQSTARQEPFWQGLEFSGLGFSYGSEGPAALSDISFDLGPGRSIAVVGPSGAGKSTLIQIIQRFWEYQQGEYLLGGQSVRDFSPDEIRKSLAIVSQSPYFFNASIKDNLLLGNPKLSIEEIKEAARLAQIHNSIASLPKGYETWIGERGLRLSGGERQRLAVARALVRHTPVLLLDEPTANLDPLTARALLEMLFGLMRKGGQSTLMITHRFWGLENFDEVLVLDKGRIIERGTHSELLKARGMYLKLWELQKSVLWI